MEDTIIEYKDVLIPLLMNVSRSFIVFIIALAIVYLFGRMLNILKTNTSRNFIAFIVIVGATFFQEYFIMENHENIAEMIYSIVVYSAISIILYVTIGFKFYERIDNLLDKKLANDEKKKYNKK